MEKTKLVRLPRLAIGVVILLFAGIIYAWSIINAPFRLVDAEGDIINAAQLGLNYTLTICFFCLGGLFSGLVSKRTSTSFRLVLSALLLFAGFFIASRLIGPIGDGGSFVPLYLSYGVLSGLGIGFAYNTVISTTNAWFPDKQGLSSGVLLLGFGLSPMVVGRVADLMGRSESVGWSGAYVIFAVSIGFILLFSSLLVKPPHSGISFPASKSAKKAGTSDAVEDHTSLEMIRRPSFYKIFIFITLLAAPGSAAISSASVIMTDLGASESFAVTAVGVLALFNGLGRLVAGWLFDNIGVRKTQIVSSVVAIIAPLTVVVALVSNSIVLGLAGVSLCGFTFGFAPTTGSGFAAAFFGRKNFPLNFSIINLILIPAPFAATLAGGVRDMTGGFLIAFLILTGLTVVGFMVNLSIKNP